MCFTFFFILMNIIMLMLLGFVPRKEWCRITHWSWWILSHVKNCAMWLASWNTWGPLLLSVFWCYVDWCVFFLLRCDEKFNVCVYRCCAYTMMNNSKQFEFTFFRLYDAFFSLSLRLNGANIFFFDFTLFFFFDLNFMYVHLFVVLVSELRCLLQCIFSSNFFCMMNVLSI